jgi:Predicted flavin-nucleotide-binding protein structurally related to pyridoxine 5''-phosphate oxidase
MATSSKDGIPNVVPLGMVILQADGETIWAVDNFMNKTLANVKENPKAAIVVFNPDGKESYQIKGSVTVENSGKDYEAAVKFAHEKRETLPAKNLLKIKITDIFYVSPGPNAGKRV